jgi:hypothetical protein
MFGLVAGYAIVFNLHNSSVLRNRSVSQEKQNGCARKVNDSRSRHLRKTRYSLDHNA